MFAIGIDIGGTNSRLGVVDLSGNLIEIKTIPTDISIAPKDFLQSIAQECTPFLPCCSSVGICIAGQVHNGTLFFAPNLHWKNIAVASLFSSMVKLPVTLGNDVRAALYGEWISGVGKGYQDILLLSLGTGVGGAVITEGHLMRGSRDSAGEVGHVCIEMNGRQCTCGSRGCLEAYVGGWAITKEANGLSPAEVFEKAKQGDKQQISHIKNICKALGVGIVSLVNVLNPKLIVLTGGVLQAHPEILQVVKREVDKRALNVATEHLEWKLGKLSYPGVIGSALESIKSISSSEKQLL